MARWETRATFDHAGVVINISEIRSHLQQGKATNIDLFHMQRKDWMTDTSHLWQDAEICKPSPWGALHVPRKDIFNGTGGWLHQLTATAWRETQAQDAWQWSVSLHHLNDQHHENKSLQFTSIYQIRIHCHHQYMDIGLGSFFPISTNILQNPTECNGCGCLVLGNEIDIKRNWQLFHVKGVGQSTLNRPRESVGIPCLSVFIMRWYRETMRATCLHQKKHCFLCISLHSIYTANCWDTCVKSRQHFDFECHAHTRFWGLQDILKG